MKFLDPLRSAYSLALQPATVAQVLKKIVRAGNKKPSGLGHFT